MACQTPKPLLPQQQLPKHEKSTGKGKGNCSNCPNKHKSKGVSSC